MIKKNLLQSASDAQKPLGLAYLVGRLDHVLNKRLRDSLAPTGLTVTQYTALSVFRKLGSLSNAQLAERTMISPQSANEMVKAMEAKGWIERKPDPSHGRIIQISLTGEGQAILQECDAKVREVEQLMFPDLLDEERAQLHAQLRAAVRALSLEGI
ncbi:transcriptional regulator, MarR family [Collimonas sp. OK607]|uniref:MarR family winged helix-turn-helix transcriptional regulator n=1 Tax=Collimonas sp. OK607 TaxID=1798194 RepID=UPI0008DEEB13|nr:MarR family transcriptional regulator [Collimonas sp. OK607]SFA99035.1 transcriptional regulator, MarR family [Collimonas sp. OK607]